MNDLKNSTFKASRHAKHKNMILHTNLKVQKKIYCETSNAHAVAKRLLFSQYPRCAVDIFFKQDLSGNKTFENNSFSHKSLKKSKSIVRNALNIIKNGMLTADVSALCWWTNKERA